MNTPTKTKSTRAKSKTTPVIELGADLSPAVKAIESAYRQIQKRFATSDAPAPDVTIVVKRDERAWGHTTVAKVWAPSKSKDDPANRFEIMISGENLRRGAEDVAATLLHEAAHARNLASGILDTDTNGRHNLAFKTRAESHGLDVAAAGWHGYTLTTFNDAGRKTWRSMIATIDRGLRKAAAVAPANLDHVDISSLLPPTPPVTVRPGGFAPVAPPKRGNRNLTKAVCKCGFSIRAARGVLEAAAPKCKACKSTFKAVA